MDEQASIPPTLPRPNPTISGWQDPPDAIADLRSTVALPETADVVVIGSGSGISGASIALGLLEVGKDMNLVMIEARHACSGATGRNNLPPLLFSRTWLHQPGQSSYRWPYQKVPSYRSLYDNVRTNGAAEAIKIARLEYNNAAENSAKSHETTGAPPPVATGTCPAHSLQAR